DHASGGVQDWVMVEEVRFDPDAAGPRPDLTAIRFSIIVSGQRTAEATVWVDPATGLPVHRVQVVNFPSGQMRVTESYEFLTGAMSTRHPVRDVRLRGGNAHLDVAERSLNAYRWVAYATMIRPSRVADTGALHGACRRQDPAGGRGRGHRGAGSAPGTLRRLNDSKRGTNPHDRIRRPRPARIPTG